MHIGTIFRRSVFILKSEGIKSLVSRIWWRFARARRQGISTGIGNLLKKTDIIGFYDFVLERDAGVLADSSDIDKKTINWFIPDFGVGSGGHLNIFRYAHHLEKLGYVNRICLVGSHRHSSPEQAKALIRKHFFPLDADVFFGKNDLPPAYVSFATGWTTAYALRGFGKTVHKLYFVQDFEPFFYAHGSEYNFAEATYSFGFTGVCAGGWLTTKLSQEYGMTCHSLGFSYDRNLYVQTPRRDTNIKRIFCYCRPPTVRRGLETALLALDLVGRKIPDVKFIFAGWDMSEYHFPHEHLNAGILSLEELPDLYSQCDIGLVISFTNLSLLPLELMACGCVVVSNRGENTEWLLDDSNSILTNAAPHAVADAIAEVLTDPSLRERVASRAKKFADSTSWETEAERLHSILNSLSEGFQGHAVQSQLVAH